MWLANVFHSIYPLRSFITTFHKACGYMATFENHQDKQNTMNYQTYNKFDENQRIKHQNIKSLTFLSRTV